MEKPSEEMRVLRFGPFEANFTTGELRKHGIRLKLQDQPFQVLKMLLARSGQLVTREEIRQTLWPSGTFVDFDNGLNAAVNRLREALGDSAEHPRFIETLPRRGYRFIGALDGPAQEVQPGKASTPSLPATEELAGSSDTSGGFQSRLRGTPRPKSILIASAVSVLLLTLLFGVKPEWRQRLLRREVTPQFRIRSIAVLPLDNLSGDPAQEYFAAGMTDELTTALAKISNLRVISRTSAAQYKGTHKRLADVAKELSVDAVVEGAVLRSGDRVRINAQLVHAPTDTHLWADTYERDARDVLELQDEVSQAIARKISLTLSPEDRARLNAGPTSPEAFDDYLQGRFYWNKWTEDGVRKGIAYFEKAIQANSNYALAYAGLADSYNSLGDFGIAVMPPREANARAEAAALKAIALDENLAEAHAALAMARFRCDRNWHDVENEFNKAIQLNPGYATAHHWFSHYLMATGRWEESLSESRRAFELSPVDPETGVHLQWYFYNTHNYDQTIHHGLKTLELDPNFNEIHLYLGLAYEQKAKYRDAIAELQKAAVLSNGRSIALSSLGHAYALSGQKREALKLLQRLEDLSRHQYVSPYDIAIVHVGLGNKDSALSSLEQAYKAGSYWLFTIETDPRLDPIRSDIRFQELVRRVGLPL